MKPSLTLLALLLVACGDDASIDCPDGFTLRDSVCTTPDGAHRRWLARENPSEAAKSSPRISSRSRS